MRCSPRLRLLGLPLLLLVACSDGSSSESEPPLPDGTLHVFDLDLDIELGGDEVFFDLPFPSDLRLDADQRPDLRGYPNPRKADIVSDLLRVSADRKLWSSIPVAWFRFSEALAPRSENDVIPASVDAPIFLVDLSEGPARGTLIPVIARTLAPGLFVPEFVLGVAPVRGFILEAGHRYAVVVRRSANNAAGEALAVPTALAALAADETPEGRFGAAAATLYAPLWEVLDDLSVPRDAVAAATVFTVGDVVHELFDLSEAVRDAHDASFGTLRLDPTDGTEHEALCELIGTIEYPRFQAGEPPYGEEGLFVIGADGAPVQQGSETARVVLTLPRQTMPAEGFPLMIELHGSGGLPRDLVDRGPSTRAGGPNTARRGPASVVAPFGIGAVSTSLPVNPERVPGASGIEYLNFTNLAAFRDTFRQGVIEQRLLLDALGSLRIDPELLEGCDDIALPAGADAYFFNVERVVTRGQSMGGMYSNMLSAVEPRVIAMSPSGAGGFWSQMILVTDLVPGAADLLSLLLATPTEELSFMHPGLHLLAFGWEGAEPMVYTSRVAARPLPDHPARDIYYPVGKGDVYFATEIFDIAALATGSEQAGDIEWESMQTLLALDDRDGITPYPVTANRSATNGESYTAAVVQYLGDGIDDPHYIFTQRDEVKHQYGCFFSTAFERGRATVPAPADIGTECE